MSSIIRNLATLVMNYPPTEVAILFQLVQARFWFLYLPKPLAIHGATFLTFLQLPRIFEAAALLSIVGNDANPQPILLACYLVAISEILIAMSGIFIAGIIFTVRKPWARTLSVGWNLIGLTSASLTTTLLLTARAWFITISAPLIILATSHSSLLHVVTMFLLQKPSARSYFDGTSS